MKRVFSIALVFALCVGLTGCMRNAGPVQSANIPLPTVFESAAMETPAAEPAQETAKTPAVEEVPAQAAAEGAQARLEQAAVPPDGLTAYYPWERVPLPKGCELITVWNKQNGKKYLEITTVAVSTTKTQALAYFTPLLEKDAELYPPAQADYAPLDIVDLYPDVTSQTWLYADYAAETEASIEVIEVGLFTLADKETVVAATVQVTYRSAP
jgi:hypothetical protein